jgi:hypothetical protein
MVGLPPRALPKKWRIIDDLHATPFSALRLAIEPSSLVSLIIRGAQGRIRADIQKGLSFLGILIPVT